MEFTGNTKKLKINFNEDDKNFHKWNVVFEHQKQENIYLSTVNYSTKFQDYLR